MHHMIISGKRCSCELRVDHVVLRMLYDGVQPALHGAAHEGKLTPVTALDAPLGTPSQSSCLLTCTPVLQKMNINPGL